VLRVLHFLHRSDDANTVERFVLLDLVGEGLRPTERSDACTYTPGHASGIQLAATLHFQVADHPMDRTDWYFLFGLAILALLLMGPGMWSEKWGWGALDRVARLFRGKKK
jgi:hypothetical protein